MAAAVYLLNLSPTKFVLHRTPYEAWTGRKPRVSHLKVFGCIAYALVNIRSKLDEKSEKCIFICYSPQSKAYRLYNPTRGKVIINRDVAFNEEAAWEWNGEKEDSVIHIPVQLEGEHTTSLDSICLDPSSSSSSDSNNSSHGSSNNNSTPMSSHSMSLTPSSQSLQTSFDRWKIFTHLAVFPC